VHHFVPMKGECAEECTVCGEQRATKHDWYTPPHGKSSDGRYVVVIGGKYICRKCGAEQYSRVRIGSAECDASELTPLQRGILQNACEQMAEIGMPPYGEFKENFRMIALILQDKRLYFDKNMLEPVKIAVTFYLNEHSLKLMKTTASEKQDRLLLENLAGIELLEKLNRIKTNE